MLTVLIGKDWVANRDAVLHQVAQDVRNRQGNRILIVPELVSHDMERRLCMTAGDTASRYAEVLSFTRLANRVADHVGCAAQACLDNGGRIVAMAAAARQLHSRLKAYAPVETRPEFLNDLLDAVDEFKRCCISTEDLKHASTQFGGSLAQKLEELALLLEAYNSLCERGKRDPRDQMTWLLEQLNDIDFAQNHVFYVDGFPDFTRQHFAILEYLLQVSPNVTVSINCDRPASNLLAFEKAGETAAQLIRSAQNAGVPVSVRYIDSQEAALCKMRDMLFQGPILSDPSLAECLHVCRGDTIYQECYGAVQRIRELVWSGCRYRQIAIVCADMGAYKNAINLVFNRCEIPIYQSGTEDILQKSVINTVLSAMDAALGGFESADILRYLKSMLSPINMQTCDLLENYSILWGIKGNRWLTNWEYHPNGLGDQWTEEDKVQLDNLNSARETALKPLQTLQKGFLKAGNVKEQILSLCHFFEDIKLEQRLSNLAVEMDNNGDNRSAQILNQLWEILLSALEQMYDILGNTVWDTDTFTRLFKLLLSQYDVGTIPPVLDAVTVGAVNAMRCHECDHLIVLGAQEGAFPSYCGSCGVLTDQERTALREIGVPLTGGGMEGLQAEFAEIYGVFCGARKSVMVTCGASQPSFIYRRLSNLAGKEHILKDTQIISNVQEAAAVLASYDDTDAACALGIENSYRQLCHRKNFNIGRISENQVKRLYGEKLNLSASQIDRQAECRFSYFLKYGLRAKERKEISVDPAEFGTYVHAVLEYTAAEVMKLGGFHNVSLDKTKEIAFEYSELYARNRFSQLDSNRTAYLFQRNVQELGMVISELWEELRASEFFPVGFEVAFGDGQQMPAIKITGCDIQAQLRGFVDRVDVWNDGNNQYFRVVDYKTGRKDFDYCDIYNGIGLQMLLYMFALEQQGESLLGDRPVCAGVQYFPARAPILPSNGKLSSTDAKEEHAKNWKRKGLLLADMDVLEAMDPESNAKRIGYKVSKEGTLTGDIADRDQMKELKRFIFLTLKKMVNDIVSGNVEPNPYTRGSSHDSCTYCPFKPVCHFACVQTRRNFKAMSAQRFWEEIRKELYGHG